MKGVWIACERLGHGPGAPASPTLQTVWQLYEALVILSSCQFRRQLLPIRSLGL